MLAGLVLMAGMAAAATDQCPAAIPRCDPTLLVRRTAVAAAVPVKDRPPVIDGRLDDAAWAAAEPVTRLMQSRPDPGQEARLRTEARILYDDKALYVAVRLYDPTPETILAPFLRRDDETTSDWTFVEIDSRHDRRTGFDFGLNPRGVQVDGTWIDDVNFDSTWDAVWEGAARIDAEGWTAEFRIPFSQLAYTSPPGEGDGDTVWGLNIYRNSQHRGEVSNWSPRASGLAGVVSRWNDLHLRVPTHQRRIELTPYVAPRWSDTSSGNTLNAGADLRVGLGSNFNLTATVMPDFGQVEQDPSQVNLTALELFQTERRPFFIEGLEAFRFDTSLLFNTRGDSFAEESPFYSRRVGHAGQRLLGAVKLSGRTASGWTAGVFSAVAGPDTSESRPQREPTTATTVARVARDFGAGESTVGAFITNTHRPELDAMTVGVEGRHRFADRTYEVRGWWLGTRLAGDAAAIGRIAMEPQHYFQRPDAGGLRLEADATSMSGFSSEARIARLSGELTWSLATRAISPGFDLNASGFQRNANWLLAVGAWQYQRYVSSHGLRSWAVGSDNAGLGWSWRGEPRARTVNAFTQLNFRNYWDVKMSLERDFSALSLDWLRGGPAVRLPSRNTLRLSTHTDQRRPTNLGVDASLTREGDSGSYGYMISPLLTVRSTDHIAWSIGPTLQHDVVGWQYTGRDGDDYFVARVRQRTAGILTRADIAFTSRLVLQFYAQPFATIGRYDRFQELTAARASDARAQFMPVDWLGASPDAAERTLNGNVVLRWEYRPGSFFTLVWNHQRDTTLLDPTRDLRGTFGGLFGDPSSNVFLIKTSVRIGV